MNSNEHSMDTKKEFEKWLSECPVDYYQAFGPTTYMFIVPDENHTKEDQNESD